MDGINISAGICCCLMLITLFWLYIYYSNDIVKIPIDHIMYANVSEINTTNMLYENENKTLVDLS